MTLTIRSATPADAAAIAAIYDHHARHGTATFDVVGHSPAVWADKIASVHEKGWPFLVIDDGDGVMGFAYATQFRDRLAYAHTCEDSIYIADDRTGQGAGTAILEALVAASRDSGFEQMIAVVGGAEPASVAVHQRCGFVERGRMHGVGRKFGRTLDTVYLQLDLTSSA